MKQTETTSREQMLRSMLIEAHEQLAERDRRLISKSDSSEAGNGHLDALAAMQRAVEKVIPPEASLVVINKGDITLLHHPDRHAWDFPQDASGTYPGYPPANSADAIVHLEHLRAIHRAEYLVIPSMSMWWLEHYVDFGIHLRNRYAVLWADDHCAIFDLRHTMPGFKPTDVAPISDAIRMPLPRVDDSLPFGVNLSGNLLSEKGTGEAVRASMRSLAAAGIPLALNDVPDESSANQLESINLPLSRDNPYCVNLVQLNPDCIDDFFELKDASYFRGRYNIAYWVWELPDFLAKWEAIAGRFDEIWVPSDFVLDAISRSVTVPVVKIPHAVEARESKATRLHADFGIDPAAFLFFFMFDFHSSAGRKNPFGLLEAFKKAFANRRDVELVLKCARASAEQIAELRDKAGDANLHIIDRLLSRDELSELISLCDCYVSLHRAEGFGLTLAEAMSVAKPVIATGYSGNLEFMTQANSFLVKSRLTKLETDEKDYPAGSIWAEVDLNDAALLMQRVRNDPEAARLIGARAAEDVRERLSPKAVGALMQRRLNNLISWRRIPDGKGSAALRIAGQIAHILLHGSRVSVMHGGSPELLQLGAGIVTMPFPQKSGAQGAEQNETTAQLLAHLELVKRRGSAYLLVPANVLKEPNLARFFEKIGSVLQIVHQNADCRIFSLEQIMPGRWTSEEKVPLDPSDMHLMTAETNGWRSGGEDANIEFEVSPACFAAAIRIRYRYNDAGNVPAKAVLFWRQGPDYEDHNSAAIKRRLSYDLQEQTVIVNDVVRFVRFDPDTKPCDFVIESISLIKPVESSVEHA